MALPASGAIAFSSINIEFDRSAGALLSMSQLYRGGSLVGSSNINVPASGAISLSQLYGLKALLALTITSDQSELQLYQWAIANGWDNTTPLEIIINPGVIIRSNNPATPALTVNGSYPGGLTLDNYGTIAGRGGTGGTGGISGGNEPDAYGHNLSLMYGKSGTAGGTGLFAQSPFTLRNYGTITGGGGGGAGSQYSYLPEIMKGGSGGGGAGFGSGGPITVDPRYPSYKPPGAGAAGTATTGGAGGASVFDIYGNSGNPSGYPDIGRGGRGGDSGQPGAWASLGYMVAPSRYYYNSPVGQANFYGPPGVYDWRAPPGNGGYAAIGQGFITWAVYGSTYGAIS
jgi:hypothetical protein